MLTPNLRTIGSLLAALFIGTTLSALPGCGQSHAATPTPITTAGQPGPGQATFATADSAAQALVAAAKAHDKTAVAHIFGPAAGDLVSGDKVADENAFNVFAQHAGEHTQLEKKDAATALLNIGKDNWPFPIPIVRAASGQWFFDTAAGKQEILARRIGRNELESIKVCRAYVEAQREYAGQDRDGSGVAKYAQRLNSHPGQKDGLYWEAMPGAEPSPFGPLAAQAAAEGYATSGVHRHEPFHGYLYHILTRQGPAAAGGAYDYVINGNMIAGFALVAFPAAYGQGGVMTFIVSHQGKVYQKDLGPQTPDIAAAMTTYNPDETWTQVKD